MTCTLHMLHSRVHHSSWYNASQAGIYTWSWWLRSRSGQTADLWLVVCWKKESYSPPSPHTPQPLTLTKTHSMLQQFMECHNDHLCPHDSEQIVCLQRQSIVKKRPMHNTELKCTMQLLTWIASYTGEALRRVVHVFQVLACRTPFTLSVGVFSAVVCQPKTFIET